jgi:TPR repeat protein
MRGDETARHNLGLYEEEEQCNIKRALKHWMIAVRSGLSESLLHVKDLYASGHATKEDYTKALQSLQSYQEYF